MMYYTRSLAARGVSGSMVECTAAQGTPIIASHAESQTYYRDVERSDADQVKNLDAGHVLANYVADRRTRPIRRRQFCRTK